MHLNAPGYALAISPFVAGFVWYISREETDHVGPTVVRVMGGLALV
jgi:hypothetical protein